MLKSYNADLDIKSSAWVAGFPVLNTEIIFSNTPVKKGSNDDDYILDVLSQLELFYKIKDEGKEGFALTRDFVGPSIDTGFRLASKATPRKLTISVELANLCSRVLEKYSHDTEFPVDSHLSKIYFGYDGRESLKGVMGGKPYPIFWLDLDTTDQLKQKLNKAEAELFGLKNEATGVDFKAIQTFTEDFIDMNNDYLWKPYIIDKDGNSVFGERPEKHAKQAQRLHEITEWYEKETKKNQEENKIGDPGTLNEGENLSKDDAKILFSKTIIT